MGEVGLGPRDARTYAEMRGSSERLCRERRRASSGRVGSSRGDSQGHDLSSQNSGFWAASVHIRRNTGSPQVVEVTGLPGIDEEFQQAQTEKDSMRFSRVRSAALVLRTRQEGDSQLLCFGDGGIPVQCDYRSASVRCQVPYTSSEEK